ncbi:MAG: hypothetical protein JSW50_15315 [Candidatus Latescibacterota bacterium]|nr:MAG: hypothetical protein JSW50_15315 [Candidatus Latescibacterota bacterium]
MIDRVVSTLSDARANTARGLTILAAALVLVLLSENANAILLSPPAKKGKFTIGFNEMWIHRDQEWTYGWPEDEDNKSEDKYNLGALYAKYGVGDRVTLFAEFALFNGDPHLQGISYRHINLGAGFNAIFFRTHNIDFSFLLSYLENFQHDNQETACHSTTRHWAGLIQLTQVYDFSQKKHEMAIWVGPGYFRDDQTYDGGACPPRSKDSVKNFGLAVGANFLLWSHLELFGHVVYANYLQPRLGIGYQF